LIRRRQAQGRPALTLKEALRLLAPVATALQTAHQFPDKDGVICILHRDLKPENVFVVQNGPEQLSKILDFGIGKVKSATTQLIGRQSAEVSSLVAFTPGYGAPEQWVPKRYGQTGTWTDVWGFALTLVEALTGRPPIDGDQAAMLGTAIDPQRRPTPRNQGATVSDEVERVFERALAVDPKDRYSSMTELWDDLCAAAGIDRAGHSMPPGPAYAAAFGGAVTARAAAAPRSVEPLPELDLSVPAAAPRRSARSPQSSASRIDGSPHWLGGDDMFELESVATSASALTVGSGADLEGVGLTPRAAPVRPRAEHVAILRPETSPLASVGERLRGPVILVLVGVAIAAVDFAYTTTTGELFRVASLRPLWLAGPLVVIGVAMGVTRLFR
jgi:serine/threonine-protein kinase